MPTITRTITVRLDPELVALLTEMRDRLPEPRKDETALDAATRWTPKSTLGDIADELRAMKKGGMTRASVLYALDQVYFDDEPAPTDDHTSDGRCKYPKTCESEGTHDPAPTGEPVEPGDLRAGDRVAFTWKGERITGTLVSDAGGDVLRSDVRGSTGCFPNVVWRDRKWADFISDVRLIERAPREDEDEALAKVLHTANASPACDWRDVGPGSRIAYLDMARAAREHLNPDGIDWESTLSGVVQDRDAAIDRADGYRAEALQYGRAALDRANERDGWKAKYTALREDVEALRRNPKSLTDVLMRAADIIDRDDARTPQADPDTVTLSRDGGESETNR